MCVHSEYAGAGVAAALSRNKKMVQTERQQPLLCRYLETKVHPKVYQPPRYYMR